MNMTVKEIQKECRKLAKDCGATFKVHNNLHINNAPAYYFINRATGRVVMENCTLSSAHQNLLSGEIESLINN